MKKRLLLIAFGMVLSGCSDQGPQAERLPSTSSTIATTEGTLAVEGGNIWYRTVGNRDTGIPLLVLHGGPGAGSRIMQPLEALADERLVVFYDQLGAGRSEHPNDPSLWTIERHVGELNAVRDALSLDEVHILGHSWGSMLLIEYLLTNPQGVVSATFASPLFSTERWMADARQRVKEMPEQVQQVIETHEAAGTTDSAEYLEAVDAFYHRFLARTDPWPEAMTKTLEEFGNEVYSHMWGASEFNANGTLINWDRMDALPDLQLPTLFTVGEFDETLPSTVLDYASRVPGSRYEMIDGAAHLTLIDRSDQTVQIQRRFLADVEAASGPN